MSVYRCAACSQYYCANCDEISECGQCSSGACYCVDCMPDHIREQHTKEETNDGTEG